MPTYIKKLLSLVVTFILLIVGIVVLIFATVLVLDGYNTTMYGNWYNCVSLYARNIVEDVVYYWFAIVYTPNILVQIVFFLLFCGRIFIYIFKLDTHKCEYLQCGIGLGELFCILYGGYVVYTVTERYGGPILAGVVGGISCLYEWTKQSLSTTPPTKILELTPSQYFVRLVTNISVIDNLAQHETNAVLRTWLATTSQMIYETALSHLLQLSPESWRAFPSEKVAYLLSPEFINASNLWYAVFNSELQSTPLIVEYLQTRDGQAFANACRNVQEMMRQYAHAFAEK